MANSADVSPGASSAWSVDYDVSEEAIDLDAGRDAARYQVEMRFASGLTGGDGSHILRHSTIEE
jgi:hypothetical protein